MREDYVGTPSERMRDDLSRWNEGLARFVVDWKPYSEVEILLKYDNGEWFIYDRRDETIRRYFPIDRAAVRYDEKLFRKCLADRLDVLMSVHHIRTEELASETGLSRKTIYTYIDAISTPSFFNIWKIVEAIGCTIEDLLDFPYADTLEIDI